MKLIAFDTATSATVVGLSRDADAGAGGEVLGARDDPAPGERPRHTGALLTLGAELLQSAGLSWAQVERVAVGVGPGSFTGLRIGVVSARAISLACGAELVGVSTLRALAVGAEKPDLGAAVLAVLDARRGEVFVAGWRDGEQILSPCAASPERLAQLAEAAGAGRDRTCLGVGDGAVRFRSVLESSGVDVPGDESPLHRVSAAALCRLGTEAEPGPRAAVVPDYLRLPDAEIARRDRLER